MKDDSLSPDDLLDLARACETTLGRIYASLLDTHHIYHPEEEQYRVISDTLVRLTLRAALIRSNISAIKNWDQ